MTPSLFIQSDGRSYSCLVTQHHRTSNADRIRKWEKAGKIVTPCNEDHSAKIALALVNRALELPLVACVIVVVSLLMVAEDGPRLPKRINSWMAPVFGALSAFGTVWTEPRRDWMLTIAGKLVILARMRVGRAGPLMLTAYLTRPKNPLHVRFPAETLSLG